MTHFTVTLVGQRCPRLGVKKTEQAGAWLQLSSHCHSILSWIPARFPHTLSFSFQDRKTDTKQPLYFALWSEMGILAECWGAWLYLGLVGKLWNSHGMYRAECSLQPSLLSQFFCISFSCKQDLAWKLMDVTAGEPKPQWKLNECYPRPNCEVLPTFDPSITRKCPWMLSFFHP